MPEGISKDRNKRCKLRAGVVLVFLGVLLGVAGFRFLWIQTVSSSELLRSARRFQYRRVVIKGRRGRILDRNGLILAIDAPTVSLALNPDVLPRKNLEDKRETADKIVEEIWSEVEQNAGICMARRPSLATTLERIKKGRKYVPLALKIEPDRCDWAREFTRRNRAVYYQEDYHRVYPFGMIAMPVLGFTSSDHHGLEGLEVQFNRQLTGLSMDYEYLCDARRQMFDYAGGSWPAPLEGADVKTTLDICLQAKLEKMLADWLIKEEHPESWATCIALKGMTGEVLCMASLPSCNANLRKQHSDTGRKWTKNRCIEVMFTPGRGLAWLLTSHLMGGSKLVHSIRDKGDNNLVLLDDGWSWRLLEPYLISLEKSGLVTRQAIVERAHQIGIPERTGIDLPGENRGNIALLGKNKIRDKGAVRSIIENGIAVTSLQLAVSFGVSVLGTEQVEPMIIDSFIDDSEGIKKRPSGIEKGAADLSKSATFFSKIPYSNLTLSGEGSYLEDMNEPPGRSRQSLGWSVGCSAGDDPTILSVVVYARRRSASVALGFCSSGLQILDQWSHTGDEK